MMLWVFVVYSCVILISMVLFPRFWWKMIHYIKWFFIGLKKAFADDKIRAMNKLVLIIGFPYLFYSYCVGWFRELKK